MRRDRVRTDFMETSAGDRFFGLGAGLFPADLELDRLIPALGLEIGDQDEETDEHDGREHGHGHQGALLGHARDGRDRLLFGASSANSWSINIAPKTSLLGRGDPGMDGRLVTRRSRSIRRS
jgi:hypothetical protein